MTSRTPLTTDEEDERKGKNTKVDRRMYSMLLDGIPSDLPNSAIRGHIQNTARLHEVERMVLEADLSGISLISLKQALEGKFLIPDNIQRFSPESAVKLLEQGFEIVDVPDGLDIAILERELASLGSGYDDKWWLHKPGRPTISFEATLGRQIAWIPMMDDHILDFKGEEKFLEFVRDLFPDDCTPILASVEEASFLLLSYKRRTGSFPGWERFRRCRNERDFRENIAIGVFPQIRDKLSVGYWYTDQVIYGCHIIVPKEEIR